MNIVKCFILIVFISISVCLSSQKHGILRSVVNDTENLSDNVEGYITVKEDGAIYNCGGKPCEGLQYDYYDEKESKVKISGKFKNGKPVGEVKGYYENGSVKFSYIPHKKKYKYLGQKYNYCSYKEFDEHGNCTRHIDDKKGLESRYREDGSLASALYYYRKRSSVKYYVDYFPDNKKKTVIAKDNKYEYDESGRLRRHWMRKSERHHKKHGTMAATFYFVEYDVTENISRTGRFYTNLYEHDHWLHVSPEFPACFDSVPLQDFKEIVNHQLGIKDVHKWDFANNKTIITRYRQQGDIWIEMERKSVPRVVQK